MRAYTETPYGFIVQAVSAGGGPVVFQGSWAYTADVTFTT